jgi:hypothetical protein
MQVRPFRGGNLDNSKAEDQSQVMTPINFAFCHPILNFILGRDYYVAGPHAPQNCALANALSQFLD